MKPTIEGDEKSRGNNSHDDCEETNEDRGPRSSQIFSYEFHKQSISTDKTAHGK